MKRACVIGWPIAHSRSPIIHNYWLKHYGIEGHYSREPVPPGQLAAFLASLHDQGFEGCNVTIPHKEEAFRLVKPADDATRRLGVVNTVFFRDGACLGTTTDGEGFLANLADGAPQLRLDGCRCVVLGAGGAGMAVAGALLDAGATEISVANRSRERAEALAGRFGHCVKPIAWELRADALADCTLLVNTTALGMTGQPPLELSLARLPVSAVVTDIVYSPLETALLASARARGNPVVGGLGMLLHQAVRGFELWFGVRPKVTRELFELVAADVVAGSGR